MKHIARISMLLAAAFCIAAGAMTADANAAENRKVSLDQPFDDERQSYTATVPHDVTEVTLNVAAAHPKARVTVNGGDPDEPVQLAVGKNTIVIVVTAEDERYTRTYTVTVTREGEASSTVAVTLSATPNPVGEGSPVTVTATLAKALAEAVTIPLTVTRGTSEDGDHGSLASIAIPAGGTSATGTISTTDDADGDDETFTVALGSLPSGLTAGTASSVEVTITDSGLQQSTEPLTAAFENVPSEHDGTAFTFDLTLSEAPGAGNLPVAASFKVAPGKASVSGSGTQYTVTVTPKPANAWKDVTITLAGGRACAEAGTICTADGRALSNTSSATVGGPVRIRVENARAKEGKDASLDFAVTLNRAAGHEVSVDYATEDDTATAGEDYTATSGTLVFAAGETAKTVSVPVLDDAVDEGKETMRLLLSNPQGAYLRGVHSKAKGVIRNDDPLQAMWLSRFGRTVADHVTAAVSDRLANPLTGAQVTVGGQSVDLAELGDEARLGETLTAIAQIMGAPSGPAPANDPGWGPGQDPGPVFPSRQAGAAPWPGTGLGGSATLDSAPARSISGRELLLGSAFHLAKEGDGGGPGLAAWGRVTVGGFDGEAPADDGNVRIDGDVTTGILGTDAEWERLLAGVAISVSEGEGTFDQPGVDSGTIESTMTTVSPYARVTLSDRVSAWGLLGYGTGDMTIVQAANDRGQPERVTRTDLSMRLAALGGRGALLQASESGGMDLALKADGFLVETTSEAISNEGDTTGEASRVRLALEGSRAFRMGDGVLTPGLELGLRHDGGDAETGTGVELGGRVSWADQGSGLSLEANVRALVAHEDSNYREWGASGAVRLAPGERGRGLSFSLAPTYGAPGSGIERLWSAQDAQGLAPGGSDFEPESRLEGELGYGLPLLGDRFTGTPNVGFGLSGAGARDYRIGWRLTSAVPGDPGFEVTLDATRSERANDNGADTPAEHGVMLRAGIRW